MKNVEFEKLDCTYIEDLENIESNLLPFKGNIWLRKDGNVIFIKRKNIKCEWLEIDESKPYEFYTVED